MDRHKITRALGALTHSTTRESLVTELEQSLKQQIAVLRWKSRS
jgi:hypothetical protein